MKRFYGFLIFLSVVLALTIGLSIYGKRAVDSTHARASVHEYAKQMTIAVTVLDASGEPVSGASIMTESHSGISSPVTTDDVGGAMIEPGETEVLALYVDGRKTWYSPYHDSFLGMIFNPTCSNGLSFIVNLKAQ